MIAKRQNYFFCLVPETYETNSFMMTLKRVFLTNMPMNSKIFMTGLKLDRIDVFGLAQKVVKVKLCDRMIKHRRLIYTIWKKKAMEDKLSTNSALTYLKE